MNLNWTKVLIGCIIGFVLCIAYLLDQRDRTSRIMEQMVFDTQRIISSQVVIHDTVKVKEVIYDTIVKFNNSTVYSNAIPSKLDTFETHKGKTNIVIEFADGAFGMDEVSEYQLLCNGSFYDRKDEEGTEWTNCNGEWILKFKGDR